MCFLDFVATVVGYSVSDSGELCADSSNSVSFIFSLNSSNHSGRSASGSFGSFLSLIFYLLFWNFGNGTSVLVALSAFFLNESCASDAEDELLSGLVDNPGTTRGTTLSVLQMIVFPFLVNRGFWPLTHSQECPWSLQSLLSDKTAGVSIE